MQKKALHVTIFKLFQLLLASHTCVPFLGGFFFIPSSIAQFFTWYLQYTHYMTPRIALFVSMLGCVTDKQVMYSV